ncbi:MAG: gluconeogenesis factor YvcK family protein [Acidimicrobiia bacterium]
MSSGAGPNVVAVGGGHGLATTLRAVRRYAGRVTAVVSVADDGGSTGRLRRDLGVLGVGDLRKCLGALAADAADSDAADSDAAAWAETFDHRFGTGDLEGHALGNLILVGLAEATGDWVRALAIAGRVVGAVGTVLPATSEPVVLKAEVDGGEVQGQVAVQNSERRIRRIALVPPDAPSPAAVGEAIADADQIVLAPGSLFTSVLPALAARGVHEALARCRAPVAAVVNLGPQLPETVGLDVADHLRAVLDLGIRVDTAVVDPDGRLPLEPDAIAALHVDLCLAPVARPDAMAHAPAKLAPVLAALLQS